MKNGPEIRHTSIILNMKPDIILLVKNLGHGYTHECKQLGWN